VKLEGHGRSALLNSSSHIMISVVTGTVTIRNRKTGLASFTGKTAKRDGTASS
jgi:hypothetical protein